METPNSRNLHFLFIVCAAIVAHILLFVSLPSIWASAAALLIAGLLPGYVLSGWLTRDLPGPIGFIEHILYSVGTAYGIIIILMLLVSYLPGGIVRWHTLLVFDLFLVLMLIGMALEPFDKRAGAPNVRQTPEHVLAGKTFSACRSQSDRLGNRWLLAGLVVLLLFSGFFRFANLGYSEFQGDEARALLRAAETLQGYRDALLGHKKGPGEILIPAAAYSLTGRIDESTARLPFAIANFAGIIATFLLGKRLFGPLAGWGAAMLLAVDGYFIGFSRIVQYQSIVFLTAILTVLLLLRIISSTGKSNRSFVLVALLLSTGLLSHYEAALVAIPCLYLLGLFYRRLGLHQLLNSLTGPLIFGLVLLSLFYIPFILNPNFRITLAYITVNRIGVNRDSGGFPYNNLVDVFERTTLYSSSYYLFLLMGLTILSLALVYHRNLPNPWRWLAIGLWLGGVSLTAIDPSWGTVSILPEGRNDYTWLFFALSFSGTWLLPKVCWQERLVWLWFGVPMILSLFFIATPNTHVYGFFIGWALLAGMMIERIWHWSHNLVTPTTARAAGLCILMLCLMLFGNYAYWYYLHNQVEILRTWQENRPAGYWVSYEMPTNMSIFGFPFRNGWKAVGALYAQGKLTGAFTTNGRDAVADWYTRGLGYCPRDHRYYILSHAVEPAEREYLIRLKEELETNYSLWGSIVVNGEPRLQIFEQPKSETIGPQQFDLSAYEPFYDQFMSGSQFERNGPIAEALAARVIEHPLDFYFGVPPENPASAVRLRGFTIKQQSVLPGDEVQLTLYWESRRPTQIPYSVTTQLIDPSSANKVGQRDGEPICNLRPMNHWLPGELFADHYWIPVNSDAPPGTYQVLIGLYDRESGERLEVYSADGQPVGNGLGISEIYVKQP